MSIYKKIPARVIQGEHLTLSDSAYDKISVYFGGAMTHSFISEDSEGTQVVNLDFSALSPGSYKYEIWVTVEGIPELIERNNLVVEQSVRDLSAGEDLRSKAQKIVDNIEEYLANPDSNVKRYRIENSRGSQRELERHKPDELLSILKYYKGVLARENRKASGRSSLGNTYKVRFKEA